MKFCSVLTFAVSVLFSFFSFGQVSIEGEARVGLNFDGFERLKPKFHRSIKSRNDLYIEVFDGKNFALTPQKVKLRLMNGAKKKKLQLTKKIASGALKCPNQSQPSFSRKIKLKEEMKEDAFEEVFNLGHEILSALEKGKLDKEKVKIFDQKIRSKLKWRKFPETITIPKSFLFVPSQRAGKMRWQRKVKPMSTPKSYLEYTLGTTFDKKSGGDERIRYELEAEWENHPDQSRAGRQWRAHIKRQFCGFLDAANLSDAHTASTSSEEQFFYLPLYRELLRGTL